MAIGSVHLVGSFAAENAGEVFELAVKQLGSKVTNLPDGETGGRKNWILWQRDIFESNDRFESFKHEGDYRNARMAVRQDTWSRLKQGVSVEDVDLGSLGYAEDAKRSYAEFAALKASGAIPGEMRFMFALPSPYNVINVCIAPQDRLRIEPLYERAIEAELEQILEAIPHDQLSIQWDVAHDTQTYEGSRQCYFAFHQDGIVARLVKLGNLVAADVPMGYHLCYGNFGGIHFVEPRDTAPMVDLSNRISSDIGRTVEWIHMPVPIERNDDAYFEPLADLKLRPETKLYLGLVHDQDGIEGCRSRMATADKYVSDYGVATECGLGQRPAETMSAVLDLHAALV